MDTDLSLSLLIIVIIVARVYVLNFIGHVLGYGNCPSCGNSWLWNGSGSIEYETLEKDKGIVISGRIPGVVSIQVSKNIMICERCLERPDSIDSGKIKINLINHGWGSRDIELIVHAIEKFKHENED